MLVGYANASLPSFAYISMLVCLLAPAYYAFVIGAWAQ